NRAHGQARGKFFERDRVPRSRSDGQVPRRAGLTVGRSQLDAPKDRRLPFELPKMLEGRPTTLLRGEGNLVGHRSDLDLAARGPHLLSGLLRLDAGKAGADTDWTVTDQLHDGDAPSGYRVYRLVDV